MSTTTHKTSMSLSRYSYKVLGPTTIHLKFELFLLAAATLFTVANLQGLYKETFGSSGDAIYISLVAIWLSRYVIFRWLCIWDPSSSLNPSILGFFSVFLASHVYAGQTFDRPTRQAVAKFIGSPSAQIRSLSFKMLLPTSILYLYQWFKITVYFPVAHFFGIDWAVVAAPLENMMDPVMSKTPGLRNTTIAVVQYVYSTWASTGLSLAFLVSFGTFCFFAFQLLMLYVASPTQANALPSLTSQSIPFSVTSKEEIESFNPYGMYQHAIIPEWSTVFFIISVFGTFVSLICYFRVTLPIPDQVAGGNVIKDIRSEVKLSAGAGKISKRREDQDIAWNERYRPITTANRLRLSFHIRIIRMIEHVFLCGLLPRTTFVCRATHHCSSGAEAWQLTKVLYPAGITTALRRDIGYALGTIASDRISALYCIVGIALVSFVMQVSQSVLLNKSYLAIMAYISNEWDLLKDADMSNPPAAWDVRRRYKKGDLVLYPPTGPRQQVYQAISNAPEGRPTDTQLQFEHDLLGMELGHPATSNLLSKAAALQTVVTAVHVFCFILARIVGGYEASGLLFATIAHMVAAHALNTIGTVDYDAIHQVSTEISQDSSANKYYR